MKQLTLKQVIDMMKSIKENDYNDEYEVYFSSGIPIIESKIVIFGDNNES